ncbi:MAG: sigma-70 family RNA polymerase sigma factor [Gemmataceae bacterium]|nr:sigma-70 family RNA polymerase sigma factor [Gemmataceae bacterium]
MWPDPAATDDLLARAGRGDAAAIDELLATHREPLRRAVAARIDPALARRVDASDVVQDVLIEAHRRLTDYLKNPAMPFGLWLRQLAKDRMIDAHRFHRLAQRRSLDREQPTAGPAWADASSIQLLAELLDPEKTPGSAAIEHELSRQLEAALTTLDPGDQQIILMRHRDQLGNQEAAAKLGLSEAAASMRYLRALRRLRTALLGDADG